jgi:formate hydrogenlyase transcriptional activator
VLICGETGTGKELVARAIHNLSARQPATFVKLNCAAIPTGLMESEMFGHEKGAFTGAVTQRIGRFELANHGTLFLDEIGEIPLELQPKLLRVLQEQEFERLGSSRTIRVDVRLVAATNKDLQSMVRDREFRADLFYRINVFPIVMPPLRARREDIPKLVRYFVQQVARRMGKRIETIHSGTMEDLVNYSWPGNIRELQNIIERAVILSSGTVLKVPSGEWNGSPEVPGRVPQTMEEAERRHILQTLDETNWIVGGPQGAAARLGMKRSTLQSRMQKLHIHRPR